MNLLTGSNTELKPNEPICCKVANTVQTVNIDSGGRGERGGRGGCIIDWAFTDSSSPAWTKPWWLQHRFTLSTLCR